MSQFVQISFDCLPLRMVGRRDIPLDATADYKARFERVLAALTTHGSFNTYYLHNAECVYHLTNHPDIGMLHFEFEGTVFTDDLDQKSVRCDLQVRLVKETCDWLTEPVVKWFTESVQHAVRVEFDQFIATGDLEQTIRRMEAIQARCDEKGGYVGLYL